MTTYTGRPAAKSGKPVIVQRATKGKLGASSPSTPAQPVGSSSSSTAGTALLASSTTSGTTAPTKETVVSETDAKHMHDRMLFLLSHMIGLSVEITVKNGSKYEGIFHTAFTEGEFNLVLRLAKVVSGKDKKDNAPLINQLIIRGNDCMTINAIGVDFVPHEKITPERIEREGFKTDTDISRAGDIRERDLQRWAPEEHIAFEGIEDSLHNGRAGWDQFAANEKLFGVTTDFDEEIYTTKLDRTGVDFKAREQQAIQIANEIQQSVSTNIHMREERGLEVDDSGLDEEDRYSTVVRDPLPVVTNKYIPPARRQQEQNQQRRPTIPSQQLSRTSSSPAQTTPTAQIAISPVTKPPTQQITPSVQPAQAVSLQELTSTEQASTFSTTTSASVTPTAVATPATPAAPVAPVAPAAPAAPDVTKSTEGASVSRSNSTKGSSGNDQFNLNDLRTHTPVSTLNPAITQRSKQEDNLAKFFVNAKTFANNDRALVNQTRMDLTQRKTELIQMRKDGLAAELKQFGRDLTKKLVTPVPDEVKEIFSKKGDSAAASDTAKVNAAAGSTEKQRRASENLSENIKEKNRDKDKDGEKEKEKNQERTAVEIKQVKDTTDLTKSTATATATATTPPEKTVSEKPGSGSSFKFNVKASIFKPATPFTPSGDKKTSTATPSPTHSAAADKNLFFGKAIKKGPFALQDSMSSPFKEGQATPTPATITPTWPYGQRPFRHLFQQASRYEDDMMYSQGMGQHGGNGASYYAMATPYNYAPSGQFGMPPQMTMAGPGHMVPFMGAAGPVPFSQPPPPPGMPHTGAGPGFSPLAPTSAPHYASQGFSPGRSNMIPQSGLHIPMYPYPPTAHGPPVMMPYREIMPPLGPNGMMMHQRPMGLDPQMMHYPTSVREAGAGEDGISSEPASSN